LNLFESIKAITPPSRDYAEKFSFNLAVWVREHKNLTPRFYYAPQCFEKGRPAQYSEEITCPSLILVGLADDGWCHGSRLSSVLCNGRKEETCAFPPNQGPFLDITEQLLARYLRHGKCALDPEHTLYWERGRYTEDRASRVCNWCGRVEHRHETPRTVIDVTWKPAC
jgi:hypothetical protein